jgi:hypothetical protein
MRQTIRWDQVDPQLIALATPETPLHVVAKQLRISVAAIQRRAKFLGVSNKRGGSRKSPPPRARSVKAGAIARAERAAAGTDRQPLPAGSPQTWGVITCGTLLDGVPYVYQAALTARG